MKNFLIIFSIIFLKCNFLLANEFIWNKVTTAKDGSRDYYLDSKSKRTVGNYNYQWYLANNIKDADEEKSNINYATIDCKRNKLQIVLMTSYSEYSGKGQIINHRLVSDEDLTWLKADPESVLSFMIKNSCNDMNSSISSDDSKSDPSEKKTKKKKNKKYKEF
jgi:hypothetical protein